MSYTLAATIVAIAASSSARAQPAAEPPDDSHVETTSGAEAILRIDGKGRGFAGGLGIAYAASDSIELELAALKSDVWGAYAGVRYRFLTDSLRPYAAVGVPMFFFTDDTNATTAAFGARIAGGIELSLTSHISILGDLGVEHFFNISNTVYMGQVLDETVFVPTLGVIGRM